MIVAYNAQIRTGILYEYSIQDNYLSMNTYVKFSQNILFTHYLVNLLIEENKLSIKFLKSIIVEYNNLPRLQCEILSHLIQILFKDKQVELLKDIFSIVGNDKLPQNITTFNSLCHVMTNVIRFEMRKNPGLRNILIPHYAQSPTGRALYFKRYFDMDRLMLYSGDDLDCYLQHNQSNEARLYVHLMKFMQHFLGEDRDKCKNEYEIIVNLEVPSENDSMNISYYFIPQVIYQSVYENKVQNCVLDDVYRVSGRLLQNGIQSRTDIPAFEFAIIFALNYGKKNKEIIDLAHYIYENYDLTNLSLSCFYQLFLSVYAKALLEMGEAMLGADIFNQVKFKNINISENLKYYIQIRHMLIEVEFLIYKGKLIKARQKLDKIKKISQMLKFTYFNSCALELEKSI